MERFEYCFLDTLEESVFSNIICTQDSQRRTPAAELPSSSAAAKDEDKIDVGLFLTPALPQQQPQVSASKTSPAASLGTSPINSLSPAPPASATAARHRSKEGRTFYIFIMLSNDILAVDAFSAK